MASPGTTPRGRERLAAAFLLALMAIGCLVLWIGIPIGSMWASSQAVETSAEHFVVALPLTLVAMILFARALFWLNRLYLRVTLASRPDVVDEDEWDEELEGPRWARGPLEPMLVAFLIVALVALVAWFFLIAENPPRQVL
jgi:hypothetical protein